tara:strand:- start:5204 stop:5539 length:336 start_codon:yes stop_codon:yes gene_type:complete
MKNLDCAIVVANNFDILEKIFKTCDLVIATRLHAAILAQLYECPYLSISYQEKVSNYMISHGLSGSCARVDKDMKLNLQLTYEKINQNIEEMKNYNSEQRKKLLALSDMFI